MHQIDELFLDVERDNSTLYVYLRDTHDGSYNTEEDRDYNLQFPHRLPFLVYGVRSFYNMHNHSCKFSDFVDIWSKRCST